MSAQSAEGREGGLDAPTRNPIEWKSTFFYDESMGLTKRTTGRL